MNRYILLVSVSIIGAIFRHFVKKQSQNKTADYDQAPDSFKNIIDTIAPDDLIKSRVKIIENEIYITNSPDIRGADVEVFTVFDLNDPILNIYENENLIHRFTIESRDGYPDVSGRYLHSSIRVNSDSSVQMDGIISDDRDIYDKDGEGIRFQPFFLSNKESSNTSLKGQGLFQRGLHFSGFITSRNIRFICICDECRMSFSLECYHAGFSELQYFYSTNSKEILFVRYGEIENLPVQLQKDINADIITKVENQLPQTKDGNFRFYNGLKCPHCSADYIDFENHKERRTNEYYANFYLNQKPLYFN
ncbi:hypothetical protein [Flavobacterium psychrotrophum]|uniref:hypothetical protein n=1 Tax=Flavobacterium psychrotrophum TaxID=2294119 RepID=UPI000E317F16|nr:hypothetical protein [Flavobacterium psychrotrophum]